MIWGNECSFLKNERSLGKKDFIVLVILVEFSYLFIYSWMYGGI